MASFVSSLLQSWAEPPATIQPLQFTPQYSYDTQPQPQPQTSPLQQNWISDVGLLVDKLRDDAASIITSKSIQTMSSLDRKSIAQGMRLVSIAADEYDEGNEALGLEIYLSGIDKVLMALPNKPDEKTKMALKEKLSSVQERVGIIHLAALHNNPGSLSNLPQLSPLPPHSSSHSPSPSPSPPSLSLFSPVLNTFWSYRQKTICSGQPPPEPTSRFKRFSQRVIDTSVSFAVFVKQSPLPDLVCLVFENLLRFILWADHRWQVHQKIEEAGMICVKALLRVDERYHIHEYASEAAYLLVAASLKALVAYKEAPTYPHAISLQS